jgi:hypothetical protein
MDCFETKQRDSVSCGGVRARRALLIAGVVITLGIAIMFLSPEPGRVSAQLLTKRTGTGTL